MAVVQISKIQVRRGQKNSNTGIPQLSSAEFAWAVDSQELFIGNGSVAEGAPYVGNTKILTEHDNILELAASYQFAENDYSIIYSVPRSLQSKLDEYVSVLDFGAVGDGSTDCVAAFETALEQLFRNANSNFKKVLVIPNGEYLFTTDLRIPSTAIIQGETRDGVILNIGANNIQFITEDGRQLAEFTSVNRPTNVQISNLTIGRTTGQCVITGVNKSKFHNVNFRGLFRLGDTVSTITNEPAAVFWSNNSLALAVTDIVFEQCQFDSNSLSVKCTQTLSFQTKVDFKDCRFYVNEWGVYVAGVAGQDTRWQFKRTDFEEVAQQAFVSTAGRNTSFHQCDFTNCGNGQNLASSPSSSIVIFGESFGNKISSSTSNRHQAANFTTVETTKGYTDVENASKVVLFDRNYADIYISDSFRPLSVLSTANKYTYIEYSLRIGEGTQKQTRAGKLTITVDDDLSTVAITDEYQYSAPNHDDRNYPHGGTLMTNFEFTAELKDNDTDSGIDTVLVSYKNPLATGATGTISYNVTYGV